MPPKNAKKGGKKGKGGNNTGGWQGGKKGKKNKGKGGDNTGGGSKGGYKVGQVVDARRRGTGNLWESATVKGIIPPENGNPMRWSVWFDDHSLMKVTNGTVHGMVVDAADIRQKNKRGAEEIAIDESASLTSIAIDDRND